MQLFLQAGDTDALAHLHELLTPAAEPLRLPPNAIADEAGGDVTYI